MKISLKTTIEAIVLIALSMVVTYLTTEGTSITQGLLFGFIFLVLGMIVLSTIERVIMVIDETNSKKTGG
jgi:hypothetical protein